MCCVHFKKKKKTLWKLKATKFIIKANEDDLPSGSKNNCKEKKS